MAALTEPYPREPSSQHKHGKTGDVGSAEPAQNPGSRRPVNGHPEPENPSARKATPLQFSKAKAEKGTTSNDHGRAEGILDGPCDSDSSNKPNGDDHHDHKTSNSSSESAPSSGQPGSGLRVRHAARPDSPADIPASSPAYRSNSIGGSAPQSPKRAPAATTHGSVRPPPGPSVANRQRHSHTGVSSPEGGLFGLLRRPAAQPFHPPAIRPPRSGAVPAAGSTAAGSVLAPRARRAGGSAVVASAAAAVAAARPSPGAFIRYVVAPLVLLPVAWPWLLLRGAQALMATVCLLAAAVVDGLILLADVMRRHRSGAEVLSTWASGWLAWVVVRYWGGLAQLHAGCEEALGRISQIVTPMLAAALSRSPAAARVLRFFSPLLAAVAKAQAVVYGAYCFVHDEIVPVALDLAERLPLVHGLLHRAVVGGNA